MRGSSFPSSVPWRTPTRSHNAFRLLSGHEGQFSTDLCCLWSSDVRLTRPGRRISSLETTGATHLFPFRRQNEGATKKEMALYHDAYSDEEALDDSWTCSAGRP